MKQVALSPIHSVRFIALVHCEAPAVYCRSQDTPPHHSLVLVESGVFYGQDASGRTYCGEPSDVLYFPEGRPRDTWNDPDRRFRGLQLMFDWDAPAGAFPPIVHDHRGRLRTLMQWQLEETKPRVPGQYEEIGYGFLVGILAEYARLGRHPVHPLVRQVRHFALARLGERLTLERLAAEVGLSRFHFARRYRELAGVSPMADIQSLRLEAAQEYLLTTDLPLKAIAARVGFADASHLARLFRAHFGVGTRSYRS